MGAHKRAVAPPLPAKFEQRLHLFVGVCQDVIDQAYKFNSLNPVLRIVVGARYVKIVKHRDTHNQFGDTYGFVEIASGNVHRAKSFKYPSAPVVSNIHNSDVGARHATPDHVK